MREVSLSEKAPVGLRVFGFLGLPISDVCENCSVANFVTAE